MQIAKYKKVAVAIGAGLALGAVVTDASAASLLSTDMATALDAGFVDLKDTAGDVIAKAWPWMLGITAIMMLPRLGQKLFKMAGRG